MSEFHVQVVKIGKVGQHPNADRLSITEVCGRYPVIFQKGAFAPGDLAVHIPPDALVPVDRPEFSFLADKAKNGVHRVKFIKLRKVPSFGFLVPVPDGLDLREGDDVRSVLGVEKYDPGPCYQLDGGIAGSHMRIPQEGVVPYYDLEGLRKFESMLEPGELVHVTEKIHGCNGRWVYLDGQLYCGSRTKFRVDSVWNRMAEKYNLEAILRENPGLVLYGEVYGTGIQDLTYGLDNEQRVLFFDIYDSKTGRWHNVVDFEMFCDRYELPQAPELYSGPFELEKMYELAEGQSTIATHVREGIVVRPYAERYDSKAGRVILKLAGEGYLLR